MEGLVGQRNHQTSAQGLVKESQQELGSASNLLTGKREARMFRSWVHMHGKGTAAGLENPGSGTEDLEANCSGLGKLGEHQSSWLPLLDPKAKKREMPRRGRDVNKPCRMGYKWALQWRSTSTSLFSELLNMIRFTCVVGAVSHWVGLCTLPAVMKSLGRGLLVLWLQ